MRKGIIVDVGADDRAWLTVIVADRNSPSDVLLTADGSGTAMIMRQTGKSKSMVWRWQERFMQAGVAGLLRDKTRPSRKPPLDKAVACAGGRTDGWRLAWRGDPLDGGGDGQGDRD